MPEPTISAEAVEATAEALWNEGEYRDPSGPPEDDWCPPGHEVEAEPPKTPLLWETVVAAGRYDGDQDDFRHDARAALQAAYPALRSQLLDELREGLLSEFKKLRHEHRVGQETVGYVEAAFANLDQGGER